MNKFLEKLTYGLLVFTLILMPFSTFLLQLFRYSFEKYGYSLSDSMVILTTGWKEVVMLILALVLLLRTIILKKLPFKITLLDLWIFIFTLLFLLIGGLISKNSSWIIFGFRYDLEVFAFYFIARSVLKTRTDLFSLLKLLLALSIPLSIFAILQTTLLPKEFLERFGYSWGNMIATGNPLPPYHMVFGDVVRAMATFPGPNSLAMYAGFMTILAVILGPKLLPKSLAIIIAILSAITLVLTFSRGHLVSVILAGILSLFVLKYLYKKVENKFKLAGITTVIILAILIGTTFATFGLEYLGSKTSGLIAEIIDRPGSTSIHEEVRQQAWDGIKLKPFGHGLGSAGLATTNTKGVVFNPESWFIQIVYELGWISLILVSGLIYFLSLAILQMKEKLADPTDQKVVSFLFVSLLAIIFAANFLPCWFEVGSLIWWILFGFLYSDYLHTFPPKKLISR